MLSLPLKMKLFSILAKSLSKIRNCTFPAVPYFKWKLELVFNILPLIVVYQEKTLPNQVK